MYATEAIRHLLHSACVRACVRACVHVYACIQLPGSRPSANECLVGSPSLLSGLLRASLPSPAVAFAVLQRLRRAPRLAMRAPIEVKRKDGDTLKNEMKSRGKLIPSSLRAAFYTTSIGSVFDSQRGNIDSRQELQHRLLRLEWLYK